MFRQQRVGTEDENNVDTKISSFSLKTSATWQLGRGNCW